MNESAMMAGARNFDARLAEAVRRAEPLLAKFIALLFAAS
jgi:hypothetical protein